MDSALRPREIQARIRAGQSFDEVARLSGEPPERIQRFAAPVLAEREHVARLALTSSVRRRGELGGHRSLRSVVGDRLMAHGVDPDSVTWDAWRNEDKRWTVQAAWTQEEQQRSARFQFDLVSRFSVANDPESRWLIAEDEEAVERDELALVHAVGGDPTHGDGSPATVRHADPDEEPTISLSDEPPGFQVASGEDDWVPRSAATPQEIREELEAEIDGYGVVPEGRSELDVLYDMLSGIAEDSINIYAGLTDPVVSEPTEPNEPASPVDAQSEPASPVVAQPEPESTAERSEPSVVPSGAAEIETSEASAEASPEPPRSGSVAETGNRPPSPTSDPASDPAIEPTSAAPPAPQPPHEAPAADAPEEPADADTLQPAEAGQSAEAGQPTLVADEPTIQVAPGASKRRGARKKRASVPSWDEIMFGGPKRD